MPILAVGLMMIGVFFYVMPLTKEKFIDDKRANAYNVVSVAYTVVAEYDRRVAKGELTLKEAQKGATDSVRSIRFGKNGTDTYGLMILSQNADSPYISGPRRNTLYHLRIKTAS